MRLVLARGFLARALVLGVLAACASPGAQTRAVDQAEEFVTALNAKDVDELLGASAAPFHYRNQSWASAPDGSGFVLGEAVDRTVPDAAALREFFADLTTTVAVEQTRAVSEPPPKSALLGEQLKGAPGGWEKLETFVFLRGEGDVEHVAIVGVDPTSHKVTALYVN